MPNASPTFAVGSSAGTFSVSPAGLVFVNVNTGVIDLLATVAGTYTITNVVNDCSGNPIVSSDVVTINPTPFLSTSLTPPFICSGSSFSYTAISNLPSTTILWSRELTTGIQEAASTGIGDVSETITNTTSLPIDVVYSYTLSTSNCNSAQDVILNVRPIPVLSSTLNAGVICSGTAISYSVTSSTPAATFVWTRPTIVGINEPGTSGNGDLLEQLNNSTLSPITVNYNYITTANGCTNLGEDVTMIIAPVTTVVPSSQTICSGTSTSLVLASPVNGTTFAWTVVQSGISGALPDANKDTIEQVLVTVGASFGTAVYHVLPSAIGCAGIPIDVPVTINLPVTANAGEDVKIAYGKDVEIGATPTSLQGATYLWTPAEALNDITSANPIANPIIRTSYEVTASVISNGLTCVGKDTVVITVSPPVYPLNGFTPNGDGVNDVWDIDFLADYPDCIVEVYNRWGEMLFRSPAGYTTKWNGMYNGNSLPVGTYYYVIKLNNPDYPEAYTGPVTILR